MTEQIAQNKRYVIRYNTDTDTWSATVQTHRRKAVRLATLDDIQHFYQWEYDKIFPGFSTDDGHECLLGNAAIPDAQMVIWQVPVVDELQAERMPPDIYRFLKTGNGYVLKRVDRIEQDDYVDLHNPVQEIYADADWFFHNREAYERLHLRHRRACLAWGPQGNGKTREIIRVFSELVRKHSAYALILPTAENDMSYLDPYRRALSGHNVLFGIEEITEKFDHGRSVEPVLTFLDGDGSWSNSYLVATTNYPEKLPENVANRPGRFDLKLEVGNPTPEARRAYLAHFLDNSGDLDRLVEATDKLSIAYLKELIIQTKLYGRSFEEVLRRFNDDQRLCRKAFSRKDSVGFGRE